MHIKSKITPTKSLCPIQPPSMTCVGQHLKDKSMVKTGRLSVPVSLRITLKFWRRKSPFNLGMKISGVCCPEFGAIFNGWVCFHWYCLSNSYLSLMTIVSNHADLKIHPSVFEIFPDKLWPTGLQCIVLRTNRIGIILGLDC